MSSGFLACARFTASVLFLTLLPVTSTWASSNVSVGKRVTPQVPVAGEPVEFEITVSNAGPDAALGVHLIEKLPTQLQVPAGMAVFVSQGSYDANTGEWTLGDVAAASATMTIPAERVGATVRDQYRKRVADSG